jgi:hypothetical protein
MIKEEVGKALASIWEGSNRGISRTMLLLAANLANSFSAGLSELAGGG